MINIQGHTSAECQNMYSGLKPGKVHPDQAIGHYIVSHPAHSHLTQVSPALTPALLHIHGVAAWVPLQKAVILLEKTTLKPKHRPSCRFAFWKWIQESSYPRDPKSHIFKIYFASRRDFRDPSSDLVDQRVICLLPIGLCVSENKVRVTWQNPAFFSKATSCFRGLWALEQ